MSRRRRIMDVETDQAVVAETIKGKSFKIYLNQDGEFYADHQGEHIRADSLRALRNKLRVLIAGTTALSIPFTMEGQGWRSEGLSHGIIVGVHDGNKNILVKFDGRDKTEQEGRYGRGDNFMRRFTSDEVRQYTKLLKSVADAEKALDKFKAERKLKDPEFLRMVGR